MELDKTAAAFHTTEWTILGILREDEHPRRDEVRAHLIERYWPAVYAWLRHRGMQRDEASETTQAFFAEVVLGRRLLERADAKLGRLRSLILASLKHFVIDQHRRRTAGTTRNGVERGRLDEEDRLIERCADTREDDAFDMRWALGVLEESIRRCESQYRNGGRVDYWQAFEARVLQPSISGNEPRALHELATELGFRDGAHVSVAVHLVKSRCRNVFKQVVAETLGEPAEFEDEFRVISRLLA